MAYSRDFRLKVLAAVDRGETDQAVARRFDIGERTVGRYKQRRELTGDVEAFKTGPEKPTKLTPDDDQIMREQIAARPGITAQQLVPMLSVDISISAVCRRRIKLGLSPKKSR